MVGGEALSTLRRLGIQDLGLCSRRVLQDDSMLDMLVTGDGNRNHGRASFPEHIDTALLHGWGVELYSWKDSMSSVHRKDEIPRPAVVCIYCCDSTMSSASLSSSSSSAMLTTTPCLAMFQASFSSKN